MEKKQTVYMLLTLLVISQQFHHVSNQGVLDMVKPFLKDNRSFATILQTIVPILLGTESTVNTLRLAVNYSLPLLAYDTDGVALKLLTSGAGDLPDFIGNPAFQETVKVLLTELNAHADLLKDPEYYVFENGKAVSIKIGKFLSKLNYGGVLSELYQPVILPLVSEVKDSMFTYNSTDRELSPQCYSDVMTFFDGLFVGDKEAVNMFDAVGKPTMGINKGVLYFMGDYDECLAVHAVSGGSMTNATRAVPAASYDFKGRYCRATFDPPRSLIESVAGEHINETHGLPLTLSWGMCLPDSCSAEDIEGLLNLGLLGEWFNITVKESHCSEDQHFAEDNKAHVIIGILGGLLVLVVICSVLDLIFFHQPSKGESEVSKKYSLNDIPMYDNMAFNETKLTRQVPQTDDAQTTDTQTGTTDNGYSTPVRENGGTGYVKTVGETELGSNGHFVPGKLELLEMTMDSDLTADLYGGRQGRLVTLIRGFSVFTNLPTLMDTETKVGDIPCIHGIRVLSMAFILLANTFLYTVLSVSEVPVAVNLMDSFDFMNRWTFQPILQASLNTDTFFLISGCLTSYWFLARTKGTDSKVSVMLWLKFYAGRYWKMTPPYMLVLVLYVYLYMFLGDGPMWPDRMKLADNCQTDWWKHLLYISNLVGVDGVSAEDQCMPWSWYLAVNMQFYLLAPVFLSLLVYSSSMGLLLLSIFGSAGVLAAGLKESEYGGDLLTTRVDGGAYWNNVFIKPWCRVAPFCIGLALGYVLYRRQTKGKQLKKWLAAILWVVTLLPAVLVLYCQYTKYVDDAEPWTRAQDSAFEALSRPVWAIAVGWIIYACYDGLAGPLSDFFSWPGFVPLSRVTFLVYLLHPIIIVMFTYSKRALIHINDFEMIYLYIGHLVLSYAAAFMAALVFDLPFRNVRRAIQHKQVNTPY